MDRQTFDSLLNESLERTKDTLITKGEEYQSDGDVFHNFVQAAKIQGITKEQALLGMWCKHIVSIVDMINSNLIYPETYIKEKLGDDRAYNCIMEAMLLENSIKIEENKK